MQPRDQDLRRNAEKEIRAEPDATQETRPGVQAELNNRAAGDTNNVRLCHTITWPVARYVGFNAYNVNTKCSHQIIVPGTDPERDQAEKFRAEPNEEDSMGRSENIRAEPTAEYAMG